jgi:hypothetical protein
MFQQLVAIIIIIFFLTKLIMQKRANKVSNAEFSIWLFFWTIAIIAIIFIKSIDAFLLKIGFSGTGIEVLLYIAVLILFYYLINLRIRFEKMERNITKIVKELTLKK